MTARKYTEARKESNKKWDAANLDRMSIAAPQGAKERWKSAAAAREKSLNQFIVDTVENEITAPTERASAPGGIILAPGVFKTAQEAAQMAGEDLPVFIARAVEVQAQRDKLLQGMKKAPEETDA